jgi:retron-type reverse transcriptase
MRSLRFIFGSRNYHWVFEADIAACFDELEHSAVMDRVWLRIADKRVLALVKAIPGCRRHVADGQIRDSDTGTPRQCDARSHVVSGCIFGGSMMSMV